MSILKVALGLMAFAASGMPVAAQSLLSNVTILEDLPSCALPCTSAWKGCSLSDQTILAECVCTSIPLQSNFSICVQLACSSLEDQKGAFSVQSQVCEGYPTETRGGIATISAIVTIALSVPVVAGRCAARLKVTKRLWADDYMSIFTLILLLGMASMQLISVEKGIGTHYWNLDLDNILIIRLLYYVSKILYVVIQCTGKVAILLLYRRVFDTGNGARWFSTATKVMIILTLITEGVYVLLIAIQCLPVAALWDPTITDARCLDGTIAFSVGGVLNISSDIVLMILPIPALRKLKVSTRKRIGIAFVLAIASLGIVASLVRIRFIIAGASAFDFTFYNVDVFAWSLIELLCVVVCGSVPALRPLLVISLSTITSSFSSTRDGSNRMSGLSQRSGTRTDRYSAAMANRHGNASYSLSPFASADDPTGDWKKTSESDLPFRPAKVHSRSSSIKDIQAAHIATYIGHHSMSGSEEELVSSLETKK